MSDPDGGLWDVIRERCAAFEPGTELVTPLSDRPFRVQQATRDEVQVRFDDSGEERTLLRDQFEVLAERIEGRGLAIADLPPGVEPYATVLTLLADYDVEGEVIEYLPGPEEGGGTPFLRSPAEARTRPERLHDDALLLADVIDRLDPADPATLDTGALTDLYVLLSDVQHESDRLRQVARESLLARLGPEQSLHGRFGTVRRTTRERRRPTDDETVFDALDDRGIPREWVLGVDPDKLDVVLAVTDLQEDEVYDVDEQEYVQRTGTDEETKYTHLQGLADRLDALDGPEAEALRADLVDLEARLDEALSA